MLLEHKTVLLTGGASGIGRATVLMLAAQGARVLLCDVNEAGAEETIGMAGRGIVEFCHLDLTSGTSVDACVGEALARTGGKIDVLVNAAGWDRTQPFLEATQEFIDKVMGINLLGPVRLTRGIFPAMVQNGGGKIVFVSSDAGRVGSLGRPAQHHRQLCMPRPDGYAAVPRKPRAHARCPVAGDSLPPAGKARGRGRSHSVFCGSDERLRDWADPECERRADDGGLTARFPARHAVGAWGRSRCHGV
jgi:NAD(P)-dependent dehydrogenase (short-subunit alcohol dehydrogenase family)